MSVHECVFRGWIIICTLGLIADIINCANFFKNQSQVSELWDSWKMAFPTESVHRPYNSIGTTVPHCENVHLYNNNDKCTISIHWQKFLKLLSSVGNGCSWTVILNQGYVVHKRALQRGGSCEDAAGPAQSPHRWVWQWWRPRLWRLHWRANTRFAHATVEVGVGPRSIFTSAVCTAERRCHTCGPRNKWRLETETAWIAVTPLTPLTTDQY